jgi:hypothetical protein
MNGPLDAMVLALECAQAHHWPLSIHVSALDGVQTVHGSVRTDSYIWDGGGGRTDLHDVISVVWAAILRANGVASSRLLKIVGMTGSPEIYARLLRFDQPFGHVMDPTSAPTIVARIKAHTAWASHHIAETVSLADPRECEPKWWEDEAPSWTSSLRSPLREAGHDLWVSRSNPNWKYYTAANNAFSVAELDNDAAKRLRIAFMSYEPVSVQLGRRHVLHAGGLYNSVPATALRRGVEIIRCVEGEGAPPWHGPAAQPHENAILTIPIENHCIFLGNRTVAAVCCDCGYDRYLADQTAWSAQTEAAASIFNQDKEIVWALPVNPVRFEELCHVLLDSEPGFSWVRAAGSTMDRDQGRDLIADWLSPQNEANLSSSDDEAQLFQKRRLIVQIKTRKGTVGKSHVRDVRDTIERHDAKGFFLIAFPGISNDLVNYLETLSRQGYWINWWSRQQIEDRLRRQSHIVARFGDLISFRRP